MKIQTGTHTIQTTLPGQHYTDYATRPALYRLRYSASTKICETQIKSYNKHSLKTQTFGISLYKQKIPKETEKLDHASDEMVWSSSHI